VTRAADAACGTQGMLRRIRLFRGIRAQRPGYHSRFGGLWTDRLDAAARLDERRRVGQVSEALGGLLEEWIRDGYVVLRGAVDVDTCDGVRAEVEDIWRRADALHRVDLGNGQWPLEARHRSARYKLLDLHAFRGAARRALFAPAVMSFLRALFDADPLLFQSLTFETGSTQPVHQDSAYVVTSRPLEFAAAWVALEDIEPGSGELVYYPGSHRLPDHVFRSGARKWNPRVDGDRAHAAYLAGLHERSGARGLKLTPFLPRKGDVLIWSADLAHGGAAITREESTRWSLVGHYCPADVEPYYFAHGRRFRAVRAVEGGGRIASSYHPLED